METGTLHLPEASWLALFTDGLIENRHRDLDTGLELLRDVLTHGHPTPEQTCQAVVDALLPERPQDDVALLIARTRIVNPATSANGRFPPTRQWFPASVSRSAAS